MAALTCTASPSQPAGVNKRYYKQLTVEFMFC